jgi:hypothetical protein
MDVGLSVWSLPLEVLQLPVVLQVLWHTGENWHKLSAATLPGVLAALSQHHRAFY